MDLLADLTPAQREAVTHKDGPLLVVAGAGSGKTRVITRRVAHLVAQGVPGQNILAITFTNKAAGEMRHRIEQLVHAKTGITASTFHSLCARLLRRWATRVGYESSFAILDESDQRAAIRESLVEAQVDPKLFPPPKIAQAIGRAKDRLETPDDVAKGALGRFEQVVARAYKIYEQLLRQRNALDFDDLLGRTVELLRTQEDVRERLQDRFRYILIDEYQDTNHAQYELAKLLARGHGNLNATGDPDQSIYGWRGACIENILQFEKDWPGCRTVVLETNYRSTNTICEAANGLIKHNKRRKEKVLRTLKGEGPPLEYHRSADEAGEARFVADKVQSLIVAGASPASIAVFYRTNSLSRSVEQAFFERNVPYVVVGALSFYERKEVKDILAYLRVLANPRDDASAIRMLQAPARGVGKGSIEKLKKFAAEHQASLVEAVEQADGVGGIPAKARKGLAEVAGILERLRERLHDASAEALVRLVVEETNYLAYLQQEYPEEEDRASNVEALIAGAREFDTRVRVEGVTRRPEPPVERAEPRARTKQMGLFAAPSPAPVFEAPEDVLAPLEPGLRGYLEQVALLAEQDAAREEDTAEKVSLMTVHTAKGLEFDTVFIVGLEEGLFPNARALDESALGLEEERRLAYVAITRARERLVLSHADVRARFGRSDERLPSPFLFEVPEHVFEAGKAPRALSPHARTGNPIRWDDDDGDAGEVPEDADDIPFDDEPVQKRLWQKPLAGGDPKSGEVARRLLERAAAATPADAFDPKVGDRVKHEHFGIGHVLEASGSGAKKRVRILFLEHGEKNLVLQYARLTKVPS